MDSPDEEAELPVRTVVCTTPGCDNRGIPITIPCLPDVLCTGCYVMIAVENITDI